MVFTICHCMKVQLHQLLNILLLLFFLVTFAVTLHLRPPS